MDNAFVIMLVILVVAAIAITSWVSPFNSASAHFFDLAIRQNKTEGDYKVVFQPFPVNPRAGDNSTMINFSVLDKDGQNIAAIFSSLSIKEKETGKILKSFPYRLYEFSDMTFPFTFPNVGTYVLSLQTKINGDPIYAERPMVVDFDLPVEGKNIGLPFVEVMLYYVTPGLIVIAGIAIYLRKKNKI